MLYDIVEVAIIGNIIQTWLWNTYLEKRKGCDYAGSAFYGTQLRNISPHSSLPASIDLCSKYRISALEGSVLIKTKFKYTHYVVLSKEGMTPRCLRKIFDKTLNTFLANQKIQLTRMYHALTYTSLHCSEQTYIKNYSVFYSKFSVRWWQSLLIGQLSSHSPLSLALPLSTTIPIHFPSLPWN